MSFTEILKLLAALIKLLEGLSPDQAKAAAKAATAAAKSAAKGS